MRAKVTAVTTAGLYVQTAEYGAIGPCEYLPGDYDTDDMVLVSDVGSLGRPDLVVVGKIGSRPWQDLRVALSAGRPNTNPPTFATFRSGLLAWSFSASQTEQLYFEAQMPHGWLAGSTIRPHIHWSPGNSTNTGSVVWNLEYSWASVNSAFPTSSTLAVTQAASGTPYAHQLASFGDVAGTGKTESSVFLCRVARVGGDGNDTFTGVAWGISLDIHYQVSATGSPDEIPHGV